MPLFCPACKSTYQDETLVFCLNDGTRLMPLGNSVHATVQMSQPTNPLRVDPQNSEPTVQINSPVTTQIPKRKSTGLIIGLLAVAFLLVIVVVGAVGAYFMFGGNDIASVTPTPTATPVPTNTSINSNIVDKTNTSTKDLEEKLNRLEKQLEEQKRANKTNSASSDSKPNQTGYATAKVNSPNDGFLALRSNPNAETGAQIMKIPHGATVILNNCEKTTVKIGGRNGRWCQVDYADKSGWVFSAWLDY